MKEPFDIAKEEVEAYYEEVSKCMQTDALTCAIAVVAQRNMQINLSYLHIAYLRSRIVTLESALQLIHKHALTDQHGIGGTVWKIAEDVLKENRSYGEGR